MRALTFFSWQQTLTLFMRARVCEGAFRVSKGNSVGENEGESGFIANLLDEKRIYSSSCKEHKRAHPNMVLVHDSSQERSPIDLLEVDIG
jgi:hypothetical protein